MSNAYSTRPILENEIDLAYLLVEAAGFSVGNAKWRVFCNRVIEWRGATGLHDDVIVATDADGHVKGLFVTEVIQSLLFGRVLDVPMFITASAADEEGVIEELLEATRKKALEANCTDIRVWTQAGESWLRVTQGMSAQSLHAGVQFKAG